MSSESESGGENDTARLHLSALDRTESCRTLCTGREVPVQRGVRIAGIEVVQSVERLDSKFEILPFGDPGHLGEREIQVPQPRSVEQSGRCVADSQRVGRGKQEV